ncbi:hypothetical protein NQX30_04040 [Candidatus Persebacteraceae bacterium Df01]|uniref:Uncharacterized protein n=1 Tax=Candidatus Doriopsillibacter californiensis TaxID=2970740 RepID=A0ABT7QLF3_9GAMM|nr:hypothetical protein [Candidatus Persebacteraceae bacterium Df01]
MKVAWFAFIDRYQALPGDYVYAQQYISGAANGAGDGFLTIDESPMVFQHLTGSGYLRCPQCTSSNSILPSAYNSLQNSYGGIMAIFHDSSYYATLGGPENAGSARLQVHTGGRIPSNIIGEVDRKLDDGVANRGDFVFNDYESTSFTPGVADCTTKSQSAQSGGTLDESVTLWWRHATASPPVEPNCGGSVAI